MSFSAMYFNEQLQALTPYKYLDSLDSVRFKDYASARVNGAQLHAYADFFLSLLMGEGIVVPNNQLVDSLAFLDVASQLIQHAKRTNKLQYLNLRVSLFGSSDPYEIASAIFGKIGSAEKKHEDRFVLSGWPHLDKDYTRRKKWKEILALQKALPTTREFAHPDEINFVEKLNTVLGYFASEDGRWNVRAAQPNKQVRIDEINQIANLGMKDIEVLVSDLDAKTTNILVETISIVNKITKSVPDFDIRSNIINALVLPDESTLKLNPVYFEKPNHSLETYHGVLSVIDSIYNYASGFGVNAELIGHTAKASLQDTNTPSFYALALWTRLTNKTEKNFVFNSPNKLIVPSGLQWNKIIARKDIMEFIANKGFPWGIIFEATTEFEWRRSLDRYLRALRDYHTSAPGDIQDAKETEKKYLDERLRHLDQSRHRIPVQYWDIRKNEIRLEIEELSKHIEVENTLTEEVGKEASSTHRKEKSSTLEAGVKAGGEASVLNSNLYAEFSGGAKFAISMVNDRQEKISEMFQTQTTSKSSQHVLIKLKQAMKFYEEKDPNVSSIKGVIAAIEDTIA